MTTHKLFKRRVRERMSKTAESYTAARRQLERKRELPETAPTSLAGATELASDQKISEVTGRGWEAWLTLLDRWGAKQRKRGETVDFLMAQHSVPGWWAQAIATGYERTRGLRLKYQQSDGFTIYASKTVGVPIGVLFEAFTNERARSQWLADEPASLRTSQPERTARFDWGDGPTRLSVTFEAKGPAKSTVAVAHERLPDPDAAETAKLAWKERLARLKSFLESTDA